jgi:NAD(P)-dependent dehydrogenase (short-subunit alcohol dehydrogenase family)
MLAREGGQGGRGRPAGRTRRGRGREIGGAFVKCDVTRRPTARPWWPAAVALGKLMGLVNCAGIAPAAKTVGKEGAHPLALFTKTITVNLIGSFNMIRLAAEAMSKNEPEPPASAAC